MLALRMPTSGRASLLVLPLLVLLLASSPAVAADLELPGCRDNTVERNDDGSWDHPDIAGSPNAVDLPFEVNFYGQRRTQVFVNNNGNVTFDEPLSDYIPLPLTSTERVIIAPFWADVDTRPDQAGSVSFGTTIFDGRPAFCVLWSNVGYYNQKISPTNTFQLLLVGGTPGTGDFDIVFRYDRIGWELGSASDNVAARAGFSNGDPARSVELAGSAQAGAFLDGGPRALSAGSLNSAIPGTYVFRVRDGSSGNDPRNVPSGFAADSAWWTWPDGDDDGLPDNWETGGVWVGDTKVDLPGLGARPDRKDAFVYADRVAGERWNQDIKSRVRSAFGAAPLRISMHFIDGARVLNRSEVPAKVVESDDFFAAMTRLQFAATGLGGAPGSVPALAKYVCVCPDYHSDTPDRTIFGIVNGIKGDHMLLTVYEQRGFAIMRSNGEFDFGGDELASDILNATTLMHELGHLYGLRHHGQQHEPDHDFNYKSVMSYTYNSFGIPAEDPAAAIAAGSILPALDYSRISSAQPEFNLDWRMGPDFGALSLIYGQHGERGSFYNTFSEIAAPGEPLPEEAPFETIFANPEARQVIARAARQIKAAQQPARITSLKLSRTRLVGRRNIVATFRLTKRARVRITIDVKSTGRRSGGRCIARSPGRPKGKACAYTASVAHQIVQGRPGSNRVTVKRRFAGRVLPRGSMRFGVRLLRGGPTTRRNFRVG